MGPGGRYASASRIEANNALVFPPDRRMIARKSNGGTVAEQAAAVGWAAPLEAAGHLVHFHRQLDHQVAKEAVPRCSKVRILAQAKKIRCIHCIAVRCIANMRNMQNMTNMTAC